ncbi:unnamed protein product [Cylicocyclus nassatus]|uniref:Uncharacterized protein n=1 Tax=Cylicocyclus nassatus TaxID=53992 RepID=A0AA36M847_CYLNA|nr:unnamed protein product [Cylicocyclus nassatus]
MFISQLVIILAIVFILRFLFGLIRLSFMNEILSSLTWLLIGALVVWMFCRATNSYPQVEKMVERSVNRIWLFLLKSPVGRNLHHLEVALSKAL